MKQRHHLLLLIGCFGGWLAACQSPSPEAATLEAAATLDPAMAMQAAVHETITAQEANRGQQIADLFTELETAQAQWQAQAIDHYQITVRYIPNNGGIYNNSVYTLTIEDEAVTEQQVYCEPEQDCIIHKVNVDQLTATGLFEMARGALVSDQVDVINTTGFDFHPEYGIPQTIFFTEGPVIGWTVLDFQLLER